MYRTYIIGLVDLCTYTKIIKILTFYPEVKLPREDIFRGTLRGIFDYDNDHRKRFDRLFPTLSDHKLKDYWVTKIESILSSKNIDIGNMVTCDNIYHTCVHFNFDTKNEITMDELETSVIHHDSSTFNAKSLQELSFDSLAKNQMTSFIIAPGLRTYYALDGRGR